MTTILDESYEVIPKPDSVDTDDPEVMNFLLELIAIAKRSRCKASDLIEHWDWIQEKKKEGLDKGDLNWHIGVIMPGK